MLFGALGAAGAVLAGALAYAVSALLLATTSWAERTRETIREPIRRMLGAGIRFTVRHPLVGPKLLHLAVRNVCVQAFQTALLVLLAQRLGLPPVLVGVVLGAMGAGFLAGAAASPELSGRIGIGWTVVLAAAIGGLGMAMVALPGTGIVLPLVGAFAAGAGMGLYNLQSIAVRQAVTPSGLLGRVNAAVKLVSYAVMALGAFLGGALSGVLDPAAVILAAGTLGMASTAVLLAPAIRRLRGLPGED